MPPARGIDHPGAGGASAVPIRYLEEGSGRLVILLHGFPDSPSTWRFQVEPLVHAGYRVVTPWLRGYGPSPKPARVRDYHIEDLTSDVVALIAAFDEAPAAAVAGHDWGGVIAWRLAAERPELVERLIILNAPHPAAFERALRDPAQLRRSLYAFFFQLPWLPEIVLRARGMTLVRRSIERMVRREESFTTADWEDIRKTLSAPGALRAALSYYRAAGRRAASGRTGAAGRLSRIGVPTLVLWGEEDAALHPRVSRGLERWVPRVTVQRFPNAGHWVHWDEPGACAREMLTFLRERP